MMVCIVSLVLAWSDGREYVKDVGVRSEVLQWAHGQVEIQIDRSDMQRYPVVPGHFLNKQRRWVWEDRCFEVPDGVSY